MVTNATLRSRMLVLSIIATVAATMSCALDSPTIPSSIMPGPHASVVATSHIPMLDELLEEVNRRAPGFGGMYRGVGNTMNIWVTPNGDREAIEQAARAVFVEFPWDSITQVRFLSARFEVGELQTMRRKVHNDAGDALIWSDFDERRNRVTVALDESADVTSANARAKALGAPEGMVTFIHEPRPQRAGDYLNAAQRPVVGGLGIQIGDSTNTDKADCTLGFNVHLSDESGEFFVTNSHCTSRPFVVDHDSAFQWTFGAGYSVAVESRDAALRTDITPCPTYTLTQKCRYSDAAIFKYTSSSYSNLPYLAKTDGLSGTLGVDGSRFRVDSFVVTADYPEAMLLAADTTIGDTWLQKVGNRTGWTWRFVDETCIDYATLGGTLKCQYRVTAQADHGDSGSPVFDWHAYYLGVNQAWLAGILHSAWAGHNFVFSSITGIKNDYPTMSTH